MTRNRTPGAIATVDAVFQPSDEDVHAAVVLVEETIRRLGVDPGASRRESSHSVTYALRRGTARIFVAVHAPNDEVDEGRIRVVSPILRLPPGKEHGGLFQRLLEINAAELVGAAFGLSSDQIVVVAERAVRDLDASEVDVMIRNVGREADRFDDELIQAFGAVRSTDA